MVLGITGRDAPANPRLAERDWYRHGRCGSLWVFHRIPVRPNDGAISFDHVTDERHQFSLASLWH